MNERRGEPWFLAKGAALLWLAVVVAFYYVAHKPFAAANLLAVGQTMAGLVGAALVVALGAGVGVLLLRRLDLTAAERLVWAAALGLGVVSVAGLALGAAGLLRPWLLWPVTMVGLGATGRPLWQALRAARADPSWRPRGRFEALLATYCGGVLALALLGALTPPTAWDGLVYHLTGPKLWLAAGSVAHPVDLPYLGFPQLLETLFAWGMALTGERTAAAIHWFYGLLAVLALVAAGRRWLAGAAGWAAAAVLLSAPTVVLLAGWPYVELALVVYATLSFLALIRLCGTGPEARRWLALAGAFAGLALSTKYTALAVVLALAATVLVTHISPLAPRAPNLKLAARSLIGLCAAALATWSPWLLKNLLLTGNPTYPFFFDGVHWDEYRAWWFDRPGTGLLHTAPWRLLTAPWDATIWGVEGAAGYSATVGPLFLTLLPLYLLVRRRLPREKRRWAAAALAFCSVLYGFWLWGLARTALLLQTRLLFPAFGLLALLAGAAVEGLRTLPRRRLDLGWLVRTIMLGVLVLTLVGACLSAVQQQPLKVIVGFESREDFLARRLGWYWIAVDTLNRELPSDAVVLFLWEPRSYHCAVDCWPDALLDRFAHTVYLHGSADAIASAWRAEGVTHVLLHRAGLDFVLEDRFDPVTEGDLQVLDELRAHHLAPVADFGSAYELYRLEEAP